jgi:hypothetical protein
LCHKQSVLNLGGGPDEAHADAERFGAQGVARSCCGELQGIQGVHEPTALANMGGVDGLTKFMDAWKDTMSANPQLSKTLTADDMKMVTRGFGNRWPRQAEFRRPTRVSI